MFPFEIMTLPVKDLGDAVRRLKHLERYMPGQSYEVYGLGLHVADRLSGRKEPVPAADYYKAALSHQRGSHIAPSGEEMLAVARIVFPERFVKEIKTYMAQLDRERQTRERRPPH